MEYFTKIFNQAESLLLQGQIEEAEKLYRSVLEASDCHPQALYSLGIIAHRRGRLTEAIKYVSDAISSKSDLPKFHNTLGLLLEAAGQNRQAVTAYENAVKLKPDYVEAWLNMAIAFLGDGKFAEGAGCAKKVIELMPNQAMAYNALGYCQQQMGNLQDAAVCYRKAVQLKPDFAEAYNHLGVLLNEQGNYIEAVDSFKKALRIDPNYVEVYNNMAIAKKALCAFDEAIDLYRKAAEINPTFFEAFNNLANSLRDKGLCDEAIENYNRAIEINPNDYNAYRNRSLALLLNGNLHEGFKQYQHQRQLSLNIQTNRHDCKKPRWDGTPINGKTLLIHFEHGYGDNIQLIRYLPMVKKLGVTVLFEAPKPMLSLLRNFPGIDHLIEAGADRGVREDFDFYTALMDLPAIFETTLTTIPLNVPYLFADKEKTEKWKKRLDTCCYKAGIVWAGKPSHSNDLNRSCSLNSFAALAGIKNLKLFSLQKDKAASQVGMVDNFKIENLSDHLTDFCETAAVIENLDLVISVDTSVLHLAGAMGKPAWGLLPFSPDWRWLLEREDSPWYPTIKLFRQKTFGDWKDVFERVKSELKNIVA